MVDYSLVGMGAGAIIGGAVGAGVGYVLDLTDAQIVAATVGGAVMGGATGYCIGSVVQADIDRPLVINILPESACNIPDEIDLEARD